MDWFDRRILHYVLAWAPHNSMYDEDTFPTFGMRVDQLTDRFAQIIADCGDPAGRFDDADCNLLLRAHAFLLQRRPPCTDDQVVDTTGEPPAGNVRVDPLLVKGAPPQLGTSLTPAHRMGSQRADRHRPRLTASKRAIRMAGVAAHAAASRHAGNVVVIDVSAKLPTTECFVIASGADDQQVKTIVSGVEETMGLAGYLSDRREVARKGRWMLLDYVDIVVHVQHRSARNFYALEQIWKNCPVIPVGSRGSSP